MHLKPYGWYDWCYYRHHANRFLFGKEVLIRLVGPASGDGNEMTQWMLKANGELVPGRTHRPIKVSERHSSIEIDVSIERGFIGYIEISNDLMRRRWGDAVTPERTDVKADGDVFMEHEDDKKEPRMIPDIEKSVDSTGRSLS